MSFSGQRPLAVAGKEMKIFFHDPQMLFFSLALPLVLTMLMVAAFVGQSEFRAAAMIVNLDRGKYGAELAERLENVPGLTVRLLAEAEADRMLADSEAVNVIFIGEDFTARIEAGLPPAIKIKQRGSGGTEGQIANSYVGGIARELVAESSATRQVGAMLAAAGSSAADIDTSVRALFAAARENPPIAVSETAVGARPEPVAIYLPGLVTMFTLFALSLTAVNLVDERKKGTLERLMTTGTTRAELLSGIWLGNFARGMVQVIFLFGLVGAFFRIFTPAAFASVLLLGVIAVAAAAGIGLVVAAVAKTPEQANWIGVFLTMIMTILGGSFFDTAGLTGLMAVLTGLMAVLTRGTYNFWANDAFRRVILRGESVFSPGIVKDAAVLIGVGLAGWLLAVNLFRMRGDER
ncbi:MAG: ABC transporter permease [bacterium]